MKAGFKTIDCDRHVVEPIDMWDNYLEKRFKHYNVQMGGRFTLATRIGGVLQNDDSLGSPGSGMATDPIWRRKFKHGMTHNFEPQAYLEDMDAEGVDIAVCFTGIGLYATWGDNLDPDLSAAMCRAYNNWLYDFMSHDPARLKGVCLLPLQDIELAAQELRRCATELGMVGIFWRPNPHMGRLMSDRAYDPIYAIAEEYGVNISVHEGIQNRLPWFPQGRVQTHFAHHAACHPMEQMAACLAMSSGGVFDRFPNLTVSFLESGAGWLPYWLERLDQQVVKPDAQRGLRRRAQAVRVLPARPGLRFLRGRRRSPPHHRARSGRRRHHVGVRLPPPRRNDRLPARPRHPDQRGGRHPRLHEATALGQPGQVLQPEGVAARRRLPPPSAPAFSGNDDAWGECGS